MAYLQGAMHDGTVSKLHGTIRISQSSEDWATVIQEVIARLGRRSWRYREGTRGLTVVESSISIPRSVAPLVARYSAAYARGYFDAEGGIPRKPTDRFYIQLTQKDRQDLDHLRSLLTGMSIQCGSLHNPSWRIDPQYWRFYVRARSWGRFGRAVSSWHPPKRARLIERSFCA